MIYTRHALQRFAERYPDHNLTEEDGTFKPAPRRVMKKYLSSTSGKGTPSSNILKGGGRLYVSDGGCLAVVYHKPDRKVVATFVSMMNSEKYENMAT